jgi:hypothetical protein
MSHLPKRTQKDCLNCGTLVQGRFCHVCGQENKEPKESFSHLVQHFFADITHFDGKFFHSMKYLFTRPGFLASEHMAGRRASYLDPIRMYIFTSAFFFLLFFSFLHKDKGGKDILTFNGASLAEIDNMDSTEFAAFTMGLNKNDNKPAVPMSRKEFEHYRDSLTTTEGIHFTKHKYNSRQEYDSLRKAGVKKHNWIQRQLIYKEIDINQKYKSNTRDITNAFKNKLLHSIPQILFISLPLMALLFKLIYFRRKQFYYVNHAIFTVYLYIFIFLAMLVMFSINRLNDSLHWGFLNFLTTMILIWVFVYAYLAMFNFYRQGWFKTLLKYLLANLAFFIMMGVLFAFFVFFSLFKL